MKKISIRDLLSSPDEIPEGWFYLSSDRMTWSINSIGVFPDENIEEEVDNIEEDPNWMVTLDNATIEDLVENLTMSVGKPTIEELFEAFLFYFDNDAFIDK